MPRVRCASKTFGQKFIEQKLTIKNYLKTDLFFPSIFNSAFDKPVCYENKQDH
jgi:hypothetical protein